MSDEAFEQARALLVVALDAAASGNNPGVRQIMTDCAWLALSHLEGTDFSELTSQCRCPHCMREGGPE